MSAAVLKADKPQQIQVFVRTRPISRLERDGRATNCIDILGPKEISVKQPHGKKYCFDKVFGPNTKQVDVYLTVVYPLISEVLAGYNCTVFAYGQTGTGKTYTMVGGSAMAHNTWQEDETSGIIPRTLAHLFDELRILQQENTVRVSYLELYNEELYDLLAETDDTSRIRIYEDQHQKGSVIIQGIEEQTVLNKNEVYKILERGQEKRRTASTLMNAQSSRSHTVFTITVHTRETTVEGEMVVKTGKLHLVDLAGSENIGKSGAVDKRAREAGSINQSLLTLGRVIKALVERGQHIPYRESKLTRILQDSLGGRTKTSIIANISLASSNTEETVSTLEYAFRARNITNRPEINLRTSQKGLLTEYMNEIDRLRKDLTAARTGTGVYLAQDNYDKLIVDNEVKKEELAEKIVFIREMQEKLNNLEEQKAYVEAEWQALQLSFDESKKYIESITKELEKTVVEKKEEQHLAKCYEEKALKLHDEANRLLNVVTSSLNNEEKLHKKIEGIREMANENVNSVRSIIGQVANMEHVLSDNLIEHFKYSSETNKRLTQLVTRSLTKIPDARQQITTFRNKLLGEVNISATKLFNDMSEEQRNNLEMLINNVYANCVTTFDEQTNISNNSADGLYNTLLDSLDASQRHHEDFCVSLTNQIKDVSNSLEVCCKSTETNIQEIIKNITLEFTELGGCLDDQRNCLDIHLPRVQNDQKNIQRLSSLFSEAKGIIQVLATNANANETDILQQNTLNQNCVASVTNAMDLFNMQIPPVITTMNKTVEEIIDTQQSLTDKINSEKEQTTSNRTKQELTEKIQANTSTREKSLLKKTEALLRTVKVLGDTIQNKQKKIYENRKCALESDIDKINNMVTEQIDRNDTILSEFTDNYNTLEKELTALECNTNENKEIVNYTLRSTQEQLLCLVNDSLEMGKSGDTPDRMRLPLSISLIKPSPRQKILIRYKECNTEQEDGEDNYNLQDKNCELTAPLRALNDSYRHNIPSPNPPNLQKSKGSSDAVKREKENLITE